MSKNTPTMLQLKIQLRNVTKPPVWRRLQIPSDITFLELHYIIQAAFGSICRLGQDHLDKLLSYAKEPGLYGYLQCQVYAAVRVMSFYNPDLRQPVVEWFRELLRFYADYSKSHDVDRELMGLLVSEVTDLHAPELLSEVKALFDAGVVHEGTSGDYKSICRDIKKRGFENPLNLYKFNAVARFEELCNFYKE